MPKNLIRCFVLASALILSAGCAKHKISQVCFQKHCFTVEIAQSPIERSQGLMFRSSLDANQGMLFIFNDLDQHSFWMKDTLIPLDIIWLDQNQEVVFMEKNAEPCREDPCPSMKSDQKAAYVLELPAGTAQNIGLSLGDRIKFLK